MSNDSKKDLTSIEDLGEYLHELNGDNSSFELEDDAQDLNSLPDLPMDESAQEDSFETSSFQSPTNEEPFNFENNESSEESTDFSSDFGEASEEPSFLSTEPEATEWDTSDFESEIEPLSTSENTPTEEISSSLSFGDDDESSVIDEGYTPVTQSASLLSQSQEDFQEHKTENFDDVKKFAESSSYNHTTAEANPSFSLLIKNITFIEDVQDMAILLGDLKIVENIEETKKSLSRGALLIPRISEFAAVYVAHKLRRFDADILVGLSDDIHPPKYKENSELGLVSKQHLYQNQNHSFDFSRPKIDLGSIIISTAPQLDQYQVLRYIGIASEHTILDSNMVEDESSKKIQFHYEELANKLKAHAVKQNANAVIGINYHLTPLPQEFAMGPARYKLACTGNLVWVNRI